MVKKKAYTIHNWQYNTYMIVLQTNWLFISYFVNQLTIFCMHIFIPRQCAFISMINDQNKTLLLQNFFFFILTAECFTAEYINRGAGKHICLLIQN